MLNDGLAQENMKSLEAMLHMALMNKVKIWTRAVRSGIETENAAIVNRGISASAFCQCVLISGEAHR